MRFAQLESFPAVAPTQKDILRRTADALEASLARFPENPKLLHQLALANTQLGRFDPDSLSIYERAASLFPADVKIQRAMSNAFLVAHSSMLLSNVESIEQIDEGSLGRNIERLQRLATEFPDSPYIHRSLADMLLVRGDERPAVHHYRCALALGYTDIDGMCRQFEEVRRLRELSGYAAMFFAELYQRLGRLNSARQIFELYVSRPNPERIVLEKYSEFLERFVEECDDRHGEDYEWGIRELTKSSALKGNMAEALTWARQLNAEQIGHDPRLAKDMARRLMAMEDYRLAFDYLSQIPLDDEAKSILNEMTVHLEKRGELDTAVYILQYINENDVLAHRGEEEPGSKKADNNELLIEIETELQMAELHWKNRRWDQAFERYIRVLELGHEDYRSLLEPLDLLIPRVSEVQQRQLAFLANFFAERREWRRCIHYARMVLNQDPAERTMSQRVLQACERLLLEDPDDYDIRLVQGDEQLRLGNIERAMQDYRRCAEAPEYKMKASRRLAMANFRAGDFSGSFERYRNLPVLEVEDLERLYDLCIAFANNSQHKEAFEAAKLIQEYDEDFRDIRAKIAQYEEQMHRSNQGFAIDPKMRELIGDHSIGRYKYISKIGSGGMGVVHKVLDLKTNTVVAMKILREGLSSSGKAIDRFFREARIAATLHHRNIVNILDYNISNNYGQSYIAMEFVDGPSLRDVIERKFADTVDISNDDILQALVWVSQLCDALDATHKKGIIHRDIKPDNILIGPNDHVKITDFGIVHIEEATFTPTGALIGTPRYMSPEQVHGGRIDARSDIYAVGIIIYELLIGSPPFISGDISYQQVNVLPTPPMEICPAIHPSVNRIIMKCLEKAPADRYQNSLDCKRDIEETYIRLGGEGARIRPELTDDELQKIVQSSVLEVPRPRYGFRAPTTGIPLTPNPGHRAITEDQIETPPDAPRGNATEAADPDEGLYYGSQDLDSELD